MQRTMPKKFLSHRESPLRPQLFPPPPPSSAIIRHICSPPPLPGPRPDPVPTPPPSSSSTSLFLFLSLFPRIHCLAAFRFVLSIRSLLHLIGALTTTSSSSYRSPEKASSSNVASSSPYRKPRSTATHKSQSPPGRRRRRSRRYLSSVRERMHVPQKVRAHSRPSPFRVLYELFLALGPPSPDGRQASAQDQTHPAPQSQVPSQAARDSSTIFERSSRTRPWPLQGRFRHRPRRIRSQAAWKTPESSLCEMQYQKEGSCRRHGVQGQRHDRNACPCSPTLPAPRTCRRLLRS